MLLYDKQGEKNNFLNIKKHELKTEKRRRGKREEEREERRREKKKEKKKRSVEIE